MLISEFIHFREIDPSIPDTWQGKRVLSIDVDWASDDVLADTLDLVERAGVKACFFITHDTPLLGRMRANKNLELGLHPNFDPLTRGESGAKAWDIIERLASVVPEAEVLRSHAMTTSGRWLDLYKKVGITHLSNYLMFGDRNIHPFLQLNGLVETPVFFADDGELYRRANKMAGGSTPTDALGTVFGCRVYNFHPIHLFLNSESLDRYAASRQVSDDFVALRNMRFAGEGSRAWLMNLIGLDR